jgi:Na+/proline symporter
MFNASPLFFNQLAIDKLKTTAYHDQVVALEQEHKVVSLEKQDLLTAMKGKEPAVYSAALHGIQQKEAALRLRVKKMVKESGIPVENADTNYVFIRFVMDHMPKGLIGLLIAVIFLAAWGSISAALNSLSASTLIDFHKQYINANPSEAEAFKLSRLYTLFWGMFCIIFAQFATNLGSLIEAVNILGSWFYGVMLGIFLVAFYLKKVQGNAVFYAAILGEIVVIAMYAFTDIGWLWLNAIGAIAVVVFAVVAEIVLGKKQIAQ